MLGRTRRERRAKEYAGQREDEEKEEGEQSGSDQTHCCLGEKFLRVREEERGDGDEGRVVPEEEKEREKEGVN